MLAYEKMTDDELLESLASFESSVATSKTARASINAAVQIRLIIDESDRRGLGLVNKNPIHGAFSPEEEALAVERLGERFGYHRVIELCQQLMTHVHAGPADKDYDYSSTSPPRSN